MVDPTWSQVTELSEPTGAYGFYPVAVSGGVAIVGASEQTVDGNDQQGAAYVFNFSGGSWTEVRELTASDGAADDNFGYSVAMSGTTAIIGAPFHGATDHGAVYVFTLSGGTWTQDLSLIHI